MWWTALGAEQCANETTVAMGNCVGGTPPENNVFKVKNINDSKDLVQKGLMEVTQTELIYIDSMTRDDWHWPLKYLRKYGCDGDVFTFEAGRKCPGGEGLYAFSTKKASALFELVAKNINQGELQPSGEMSPFSESLNADLSFPPHRPSTSPTATEQPSYTNLDIMGNPLPNGDPASSSNPNATTTNKSVYREVIFEKPPEEHPKPHNNPQRTTSYSKIDFEQTAKFNRDFGRLGVPVESAVPGPQQSLHGGRAGSTSGQPQHRHNGASRSGGGRSRHNTYTSGNVRDRNKSEGSYSSQSSLTESSRDVSGARHNPRANGPMAAGVSPDPNSSMYQNVQVGGGASGLQDSLQQYQNVSVGAGSVSQVFENGSTPHQQPNYCNITMSSTANSTGGGGGVSPDLNTSTNSVRLNGMGNYAQLELSYEANKIPRSKSSSATPTSAVAAQSSYLKLDFPAERNASPTSASSHSHQSGRRSASVSTVPTSSSSPDQKTTVHKAGIIHQYIPEEEVVIAAPPISTTNSVKDPTKVEYEMLNFPAMKGLEELSTQREQEIEKEKEERELKEKEREKEKAKKKK